MSHKTRSQIKAIALITIGLSLIFAFVSIASRTVCADPGVLYAVQGSGDCSSWATACTLQTALIQAVSSDEIWVQAGAHYPGSTRTDSFNLQRGVALYGGFAGTETSRDERDWTAKLTILSGDIDQNDLTDPNGVVTDTANDPDLIYGDALTITTPTLPLWLTHPDYGDGAATLAGTPASADVGDHPVVLQVTDSGRLINT